MLNYDFVEFMRLYEPTKQNANHFNQANTKLNNNSIKVEYFQTPKNSKPNHNNKFLIFFL